MKVKHKNADGTFTYENGMIGTHDLPDFLNGFRNCAVRIAKTINVVMLNVPSVKPSWRSQLAGIRKRVVNAG